MRHGRIDRRSLGIALLAALLAAVLMPSGSVGAATGCFALGWEGPVLVLTYAGSLPGAFVSLFV